MFVQHFTYYLVLRYLNLVQRHHRQADTEIPVAKNVESLKSGSFTAFIGCLSVSIENDDNLCTDD